MDVVDTANNLRIYKTMEEGAVSRYDATQFKMLDDKVSIENNAGGDRLSNLLVSGNVTANVIYFGSGGSVSSGGGLDLNNVVSRGATSLTGIIIDTDHATTSLTAQVIASNILTSNTLGIGTTTPSAALSVVGTNPYSPNPTDAGIHIGISGPVATSYATIEMVGADNQCLIDFSKPGAAADFYRLISNIGGMSNLEFYGPDGTSIPALAIDVNSNVGLSTRTPSEKLEVNGNIKASGTITAPNLYVAGGQLFLESEFGGIVFRDNDPVGEAHDCKIYASSNDAKMFFLGDDFVFNGKVKVGDSASPLAKLHVVGGDYTSYLTNSSGGGVQGNILGDYVSQVDEFFGEGHPTYSWTQLNSANWDHPTSYSGSFGIYADRNIVTKEALLTHAGTLQASDFRIKKDIVDLTDTEALDKIRLIQPKKYKYKDSSRRGVESVIGFIAQEVSNVIPEAVKQTVSDIPSIMQMGTLTESNVISCADVSSLDLNKGKLVLRTIDGDEAFATIESVDSNTNTIKVFEDLTEFAGSLVVHDLATAEYEALSDTDKLGYHVVYTPEISPTDYEALDETARGSYTARHVKTTIDREGSNIFVYGQMVGDFHVLQKEVIFATGIAALQEVDRQQVADKARIATLESQVADLLTRVQALENA
jgi:hypothetical protein